MSGTLLVERSFLYIVVLIVGAAGGLALELRTNGIFACPALGYGEDRYLGYCNARSYADFDHGAFWFDLEPAATRAAARADILFIGNSRMQFGLSTRASTEWFADAALTHYLLGFSNAENIVFLDPLLGALGPRAAAYVINADGFFLNFRTPPVLEIFGATAGVAGRYRRKRIWQIPHELLCARAPGACGTELAFFRERGNGHWELNGTRGLRPGPVAETTSVDERGLEARLVRAEDFIARLPVGRGCVVLTVVPNGATDFASARALADGLGLAFIAPRLDDLRTFDGSHLDPQSAERWSAAFLDRAGGILERCVRRASRTAAATPRARAASPL